MRQTTDPGNCCGYVTANPADVSAFRAEDGSPDGALRAGRAAGVDDDGHPGRARAGRGARRGRHHDEPGEGQTRGGGGTGEARDEPAARGGASGVRPPAARGRRDRQATDDDEQQAEQRRQPAGRCRSGRASRWRSSRRAPRGRNRRRPRSARRSRSGRSSRSASWRRGGGARRRGWSRRSRPRPLRRSAATRPLRPERRLGGGAQVLVAGRRRRALRRGERDATTQRRRRRSRSYWSETRKAWASASSASRPPAAKACAASPVVFALATPSSLSSAPLPSWASASQSSASSRGRRPTRRRGAPGRRSAVASASLAHPSASMLFAEATVGALLGEQEVDRVGAQRLTGAHERDDSERLADGRGVVARVEPAVDREVGEAARLDGALGGLELGDEVDAPKAVGSPPWATTAMIALAVGPGVGRREVGAHVVATLSSTQAKEASAWVEPASAPSRPASRRSCSRRRGSRRSPGRRSGRHRRRACGR